MKILIIGVFDVPFSTNIEMFNAIKRLNHDVEYFDYRKNQKKTNFIIYKILNYLFSYIRRLGFIPNIIKSPYYKILDRKKINDNIINLNKKRNYDLVIFSKTDTINPETIKKISKISKTWYFFMDPIDQAKRINAKEYIKNSSFSSATFSDVKNYFDKYNSNNYWITQGVQKNQKYFNKEKNNQIIFCGSKDQSRNNYINFLKKNGIRVTCFGNGWDNEPIYLDELNQLYKKALIVLNFCREGDGFSIRVFQAMSSGAFILTEYCKDIETFFDKNINIDWFTSANELLIKINFYLINKNKAKNIAFNGYNLVNNNHTWDIKLKKLIEITR